MNIKSPYIQGQGAEGEDVATGAGAAEASAVPPVRRNTSPGFPPVPQAAGTGERGIETAGTEDNLPA